MATTQQGAGDAQQQRAPVPARYFDGRSSRLHQVGLSVRDGVATLGGDVERSCPLAQLRVSERSTHAVRKVTFPDGAYLEISDPAAFRELLLATGHRDGWVVRLQQSWRGALLAAGATVAALALGYQYGLPLAADWLSRAPIRQRLNPSLREPKPFWLPALTTTPTRRLRRANPSAFITRPPGPLLTRARR